MGVSRNKTEATPVTAAFLNSEKLKEQVQYRQVISDELMLVLKNSAEINTHSIDIEVISRLLATIIEPNTFGISQELDKIVHKKFVMAQAKKEKELNQHAWDCLYELQKLELFLRFKNKTSRKYKKLEFFVIDVVKETKRIEAELAKEKHIEDQNK
jgi:hypothetical protein